MLKITQDKVHVLFGDDLNDVVSFLEETPKNWYAESSHSGGRNHSWDLGVGWAGAWELAHSGWTEGAKDFSDKLNALPPNEAEPEYTYDVAGYRPDVPLYCAGDPMHMMNEGHPQGRKPIVHLVINVVASAFIGAREFANYGTAITALVGQIEATGRQVELDVVAVYNLGNAKALMGWKVKRAGDNTDLSAVAFSIAHPAAFRRISFAMVERTPRAIERPGYGYCGGLTKDLANLINVEGAFLLGGVGEASGACSSVDSAIKFAANQINKAAGEVIVEVKD